MTSSGFLIVSLKISTKAPIRKTEFVEWSATILRPHYAPSQVTESSHRQTKPMQVSFVTQKFTRKQRIFPRTTGTLTTEMLVSKNLGVKSSCLYITK